jgi:hypothetical protein
MVLGISAFSTYFSHNFMTSSVLLQQIGRYGAASIACLLVLRPARFKRCHQLLREAIMIFKMFFVGWLYWRITAVHLVMAVFKWENDLEQQQCHEEQLACDQKVIRKALLPK